LDVFLFATETAGKAVVRVSLRNQQPTITWEEFTFFDVTEPKNSLAFGPGVLSGCAPGHPVVFYIQARDRMDKERVSGQDEWAVAVTGSNGEEIGDVAITDEANGRYLVTYTVPSAGAYKVSIDFKGTWGATSGPIRKSPFTVTFDAAANPANNSFNGPLMADWIRDEIKNMCTMTKRTYDGLIREVPEDSIHVLLDVKSHLHNVTEKHDEVKLIRDSAQTSVGVVHLRFVAHWCPWTTGLFLLLRQVFGLLEDDRILAS
jgi:hypothetical protein